MKIIKITASNEISQIEYPTRNIREENDKINELIGNGGDIFELVKPRRLYTDFKAIPHVSRVPGEAVALLVDEEGRFRQNMMNPTASILYETDVHGHPIMGNVLVVGMKWKDRGISICGINDKQFNLLYPRLEKLVHKLKETEGLS